MFAVSLVLWARYARVIRGEVLSLRERDFIAQARIAGCSSTRIIAIHLFPNILNTLVVLLSQNYVTATAVLIRSIMRPEQIKVAIESKLQQVQEALAYQFRPDKERSEAERKSIAAEGESRANNIINNSLTANLLKMRGIEATLELAKSPNSKVVIVGSGKDGLPLILGNN